MKLWHKILVGVGAVVGLGVLGMMAPVDGRLNCEDAGEQVVDLFTDRPIHPIRIFGMKETSAPNADLACEANAWWNTGAESQIQIRVRYTDDGPYIFYQPI